MSDTSGATGESLPPIENVPQSDKTPISPRDAAKALSQYRWKRDAGEARAAEEPPPESEAPSHEIPPPAQAEEEIAAPPEEAPGEEPTAEIEQQEAPAPLELPRSWSKDQSEVWAKLPPDTQQYLLDQDSKATRAVRHAQNEAAETRKAIEAERTALEQARQQTEQLNAQLLQEYNQSILGSEFSDIKTQADVEKMAREDWPRFSLFQAKMMKLQNHQSIQQQAQQRQKEEFRAQADKFAKEQDAKFAEKYPDISDKTRSGAIAYLHDVGFSDDDLAKSWNLEFSWSPRDARVQEIIHDAALYRQAQKAAKTKTVKPVPTVQRPGSPAARTPEPLQQERRLEQQLEKTGHWKDAAELLMARRSRSQ